MTFLAPGWIALAGAVSLAVVAIHFISWRMPRAVTLPTARFVPDEPARLAARTVRLADLPLLALRVACVMLGGFAMARPTLRPTPEGAATVIAVQRSGAGSATALRDSLRGVPHAERTVFVVFDTAARFHDGEEAALTDAASPAVGTASLTVGLLSAIREARRLSRDYKSVSVVLATKFSRASFDRATTGVRATWRDSIRVVRLESPASVAVQVSVEVVSEGDDPVVAGIRLAESGGLLQGTSRVVRDPTVASTDWVTAGRALIVWPRARNGAAERIDAIHAGGFTAIGHFIQLPLSDSGRVIARWMDGAAAARENALGGGCVRTIGFDVPDAGDLVLTPSFQRLMSVLLAPCGGLHTVGVASDSAIATIAAAPAGTSAATVPDESRDGNRLAAALMMLAILLALLELILRRRLGTETRVRPAELAR